MHVKAKIMAFCGLLLALSVICMVLGGVFEMNTLFLLAAASFFVGIVIRMFGDNAGVAFYIAGVLLGFILVPNKFYVITFGAMSLYILIREFVWEGLGKSKIALVKKKVIFWLAKYIVFDLMYIPVCFGFQKLLFAKELEGGGLFLVILVGQLGLFIYDGAYEYTQRQLGRWRYFH